MRKFNLNLDDYAPHIKTGIKHESIFWCNKLIERYSDIKINLFVPAAYCRLKEEPCYLSEHKDWVEQVNALPENYRINMHGLHHRRVDGKHADSNNDEFEHLRGEWAENITKAMINEFEKAGLKYVRTFRPPAWKISLDAARVLTKKEFMIAGNTVYYDMLKDKVPEMKWVSYTWDMLCDPPKDKDLITFGHTSTWCNNFFNEDKFLLVDGVLQQEKFDFCFIEDFVKEK